MHHDGGLELGMFLGGLVMALVPMIPYRYDRAAQLAGPRVGNATLDAIFGIVNLNGLFVKP